MDPATVSVIGAVGRVAAAAVQRSSKSVREPRPAWSEEIDEKGGLLLEGANGETLTVLTQDQVSQISELVDRPETAALVQFMLIARLGLRDEASFAAIASEYRNTFCAQAEIFCDDNGFTWSDLGGDIWDLVVAYMESAFPVSEISSLLTREEHAVISAYVGSSRKISGAGAPANKAFRDISDILGDSERFARMRDCLFEIRNLSREYYSELNLMHTLQAVDNFRFDHDALYVPRNLRLQNSDDVRDDSFLTSPTARPRCVVIGNPGVGKSTMTRHLVHTLSATTSESFSPFAALIVSCKDAAGQDGGLFILDAMSKNLRDNLQLDVSVDILGDLVTAGRAFVIFDGIDEIIDTGARQNFVKSIESFASRYPISPVLITARRVGYEKTPFKSKEFRVFELDDFSDEQVAEYARKWFSAVDRDLSEVESFLRESESILDVRVNPLMLSLLCALYKARGYIPQNRLGVYRSCADMLFQRWDSMRHIEQPTDHRNHGTRLMQELAYFFYKSQKAQAGVQERQLVKIISQFFTSTAAVEVDEATRRAQDFLNFCAGRAWLLSYQGTDDRGERLFSFTHRTFMEYFAAESVVRRARDFNQIVDEIVAAYERDTSSVLADVIYQSADEKYDNGARDIIDALMARSQGLGRINASKYLSLCLRILNVAPVPGLTTDKVIVPLFRYWTTVAPDITRETSASLFDLYRDPRGYVLRRISGEPKWAESVLQRWARFYLRGEDLMFDPAWSIEIPAIAASIDISADGDKALLSYAIDSGIVDPPPLGKDESWLCHLLAFNRVVAGPALLEMERQVWPAEQGGFGSLLERISDDGNLTDIRPHGGSLSTVLSGIAQRNPSISAATLHDRCKSPASKEFLLWVSCAVYESSFPSLHEFHEAIDGVYGLDWFRRAAATYVDGPGTRSDEYGTVPFSNGELLDMANDPSIPKWFINWCRGRVELLRPAPE